MSESPDFEQIAAEIETLTTTSDIVEQLRQVWNARGAADVEAFEKAADYFNGIADVRALDR